MLNIRSEMSPPTRAPAMPIIRIKGGQAGMFLIYSHRPEWFCSHWNGRRSEPCIIPSDECSGCKRQLPTKWKGYLHVRKLDGEQDGFLEITPHVNDSLLSQAPSKPSLRGWRIEIRRTRGNLGRLNVCLLPKLCSDDNLPPVKSARETLSVLWTVPDDVRVLNRSV
jgi:hypothetical protein